MKKHKFFYTKLAVTNIKKNALLYVPYLLTGCFMVAMFYIMLFIVNNDALNVMHGGTILGFIMALGSVVIGMFSTVILLYTNSFLMKRRQKEIGLFNILGMGKWHIAKMMSMEIILIGIASILGGLAIGLLLSKLLLVILMRMLNFPISFGFEIAPIAIIVTIILFGVIFLLTLLSNLRRIHVAKPIELLYSGNTGEKEPKVKWPIAVIGVLALGGGYAIAITTENPISAIVLFFLAVILVILGTYCLFTAGSIAIMKLLKKNKKYYYKTGHFTTISGMLYRMKRNAVGLGNICILATMVLVMLSGTTSLFIGLDDAIRNQNPRNVEVIMNEIDRDGFETVTEFFEKSAKDCDAEISNQTYYYYVGTTCLRTENRLSFHVEKTLESLDLQVNLIPLSMYNKMQGTDVSLAPDEVMIYIWDKAYPFDTIKFEDREFKVKEKLSELNVEYNFMLRYADIYYIICPDEATIESIYATMFQIYDDKTFHGYSGYYGFDIEGDRNERIRVGNYLEEKLHELSFDSKYPARVRVSRAEESRAEFLELYGGLFFLGLFLGITFIMATVLIMYYKQISEGFEDKERFEIMQKVGMSRDEVKKTIKTQVLSVFFLPLIAACVHIGVAFKMITKLLLILNLTNVPLFLACTIGTVVAFSLIYAGVYRLTAGAYYRIVK